MTPHRCWGVLGFVLGVEKLRDVDQERVDTLGQVHIGNLIGHELSFSQSFLLGDAQTQSATHHTGVVLRESQIKQCL